MTERHLSKTANAFGFSSVEDYVTLADALAALRRAMRRGARTANPSNPLSVAQLELLSCLAEHPGARPGELARLLHLALNSVATLTTALSASNFIHRSNGPHDRRSISLSSPKKGATAVSNSQLVWEGQTMAREVIQTRTRSPSRILFRSSDDVDQMTAESRSSGEATLTVLTITMPGRPTLEAIIRGLTSESGIAASREAYDTDPGGVAMLGTFPSELTRGGLDPSWCRYS